LRGQVELLESCVVVLGEHEGDKVLGDGFELQFTFGGEAWMGGGMHKVTRPSLLNCAGFLPMASICIQRASF